MTIYWLLKSFGESYQFCLTRRGCINLLTCRFSVEATDSHSDTYASVRFDVGVNGKWCIYVRTYCHRGSHAEYGVWQFISNLPGWVQISVGFEIRSRLGLRSDLGKNAQSEVLVKFNERRVKHRAQSWLRASYRSWWCLKLVDLVHVGMRARNFKHHHDL